MNILHISANYPPRIGGPASSVPYIIEEQRKLGYNVYILTNTRLKNNLFRVIRMGIDGRNLIKQHKIDIIHVHDPNISTLAYFIIDPLHKYKSIVKYSGSLSVELMNKPNTTFKPLFNIIEHLIFSRFNRVHVQSEWNKNEVTKNCKVPFSKIMIIRNGIPNKVINKNKSDYVKPKIVSACRLQNWKGIEYVIRALKNIDAYYYIIGSGDCKYIEKLINEAHVLRKVIINFSGKIPYNELHSYLSNCNVLVVPSLYEPFGIIILDGFLSQIPVIGSNVGGIPELLPEEQLFEVGNIDDIKNKINYALLNKDKIIKIQDEKLEDYRWNKIVKDMDKEYKVLLGENYE